MKIQGLLVGVVVLVSHAAVVRAQSATVFTVGNSGASAYVINGTPNPPLTLVRGTTYTFNISTVGHPFCIQASSDRTLCTPSEVPPAGVSAEAVTSGTITFTPNGTTPAALFYVCGIHDAMRNTITIVAPPVPALGGKVLGALIAILLIAALVILRQRTRARSV